MFSENSKITVRGSVFSYKTTHLQQHKDVLEHLHRALERVISEIRIVPVGETIKKTVNLHKIIGQSHCVALNGDEEVFYAQRKGRRTLSKFVRGREAEDCSCITFAISKTTTSRYKILTAYIGYISEKEPLDPSISNEQEFNRCKDFWNNHALVEGSQNIFIDSITYECPWNTYQSKVKLRSSNQNISKINNQEMNKNKL